MAQAVTNAVSVPAQVAGKSGGKRRHVVDHQRGQVLRAVVDSSQRVFQRVARRCADRGAELPTARLTAAVRDALGVLISATLLVASQLMPISSVSRVQIAVAGLLMFTGSLLIV